MRAALAAAILLAAAMAAASPAAGDAGRETLGLPKGEASGGAVLFETWELSAEAGDQSPMRDLAGVLDAAAMGGLRAATSYYGAWRAFGTMSMARLDGPRSPAAVGFAALVSGLEWRPPSAWAPALGGGLGLYYARALERVPGEEYYFLNDGETEFGMRGSLRWGLPVGASLRLEAGAGWDLLFTGPEYSHLASLHMGVAWTP
jgi:hypothetical protein